MSESGNLRCNRFRDFMPRTRANRGEPLIDLSSPKSMDIDIFRCCEVRQHTIQFPDARGASESATHGVFNHQDFGPIPVYEFLKFVDCPRILVLLPNILHAPFKWTLWAFEKRKGKSSGKRIYRKHEISCMSIYHTSGG